MSELLLKTARLSFLEDRFLENLTPHGDHVRNEKSVWDALAASGVDDVVASLPGGTLFELGPGGSGLSQGQLHRVALARALLARPDVLVLAQPTRSLDSITELRVARSYPAMTRRSGIATVIISTRKVVLEHCDRVVRIRRGRAEALSSLSSLSEDMSRDGSDGR